MTSFPPHPLPLPDATLKRAAAELDTYVTLREEFRDLSDNVSLSLVIQGLPLQFKLTLDDVEALLDHKRAWLQTTVGIDPGPVNIDE